MLEDNEYSGIKSKESKVRKIRSGTEGGSEVVILNRGVQSNLSEKVTLGQH